jgi:hypothetical protein
MAVLTDIRNRGVTDVFFLVCDGLKGLPDAVGNVWPLTTVQTCIIHLLRNTFHLASKRDWDALKRDIRPVYTAVNAAAARDAMDQVTETWGVRYPAVIRLWDSAWEQFIPFLDYDVEIRKVLCSTNAIESLNARYRRAIKARGHFPTVMWNLGRGCQVPSATLSPLQPPRATRSARCRAGRRGRRLRTSAAVGSPLPRSRWRASVPPRKWPWPGRRPSTRSGRIPGRGLRAPHE